MRARAVTIASVFDKSLRLPGHVKNALTTGKITTLMNTDSNRIMLVYQMIAYLWASPLQIIITVLLLFNFLGVSGLIGSAAMVLLIPIQTKVANMLGKPCVCGVCVCVLSIALCV